MTGSNANSPPLQAVMLSRDPLLRARLTTMCPPGWCTASVASGYEAAAEILAGPTSALLVDLRAMSGAHRGLIELARQADVLMLGIAGVVPCDMTSADIEGLRRVEIGDVPAILASLKRARTNDQAEQVAETADLERTTEVVEIDEEAQADELEPPVAGRYVPVPEQDEPAKEPAAKAPLQVDADEDASYERVPSPAQVEQTPQPDRPAEPADSAGPSEESEPTQSAEPSPVPAAESKTLGNLLTPEEIASLLEDEQ